MRFTVALLFAVAGAGVACASSSFDVRQSVPQCALTCIANANLGGCSATDNNCLCNNSQFVDSTASCIESTCSGSDLQSALAFAQATCDSVGVNLSTAVSLSASGSATGSVSASGSASATSNSGSATGSATGAASTASASSAAGWKHQGAGGISALAAAAAGLGLAAFAF